MADLAERLALIIDARTDGAVSNIKRLALSEQEAADKAELLQARIADLNTRIARSSSGATAVQSTQLKKMTGEYQALTSTLGNVPREASRAEKALQKVGLAGLVPQGALGAAGRVLPGLAAGAAAFGAFEFLKSGIENYERLADQIRGVQQAASSSVPDASKLVAITGALGLSSDTAALGVFRLGKNIDAAPEKFAQYGIAVAKNKNGSTDLIGTLANVAGAYQATADGAARAKLVYDLFGRAGTSMLPILNANREQLAGITDQAKKAGLIFSQKDIDKARELQIATREMKDSFVALEISAAKGLVPALTDAANAAKSASQSPLAKVAGGVYSYGIRPFLTPFLGPGGGKPKKKSAADYQAEIDAENTKLAQQQLAQAAVATLAGGYDVLAGPQNLASAKTTLADAQTALTKAVDARRSARDALAKVTAGGGSAGAAQIEAANQRVTAAEANLRKAEYIGGDARVASAKAGLLSAQSRLNTLRGDGASQADKLATATDKVRIADKALRDQQAKVKTAQQAVNDATGLSVFEILARGRVQIKNQRGLASANTTLAAAGVGTAAIASIDALEKQAPGTLAKVARHLDAGIVSQLNGQQGALATAADQFATAASRPELFKTSGQKAGAAWIDGFDEARLAAFAATQPNGYGASTRKPLTQAQLNAYATSQPNGYGVTINIHGDIKTDAKTGAQLAADLAKHARLNALGLGGGRGPQP